MNNGGGGIFDHLPLAAVGENDFERAWIAPPRIDFAALAVAHGLTFRHAPSCAALTAAVETAFGEGGPWLIEVPIGRAGSLARFDAIFAKAGL